MVHRPRDLSPENSAKDFFGAELRHWRSWRGLSQAQLAAVVHFAEEMICKVEKAERFAPPDLARACDVALDTGGVLGRLWPLVEVERLRQPGSRPARALESGSGSVARRSGMVTVQVESHTGSWDTRCNAGATAGPWSCSGDRWTANADPSGAGAGYSGGPLGIESEMVMAAYQSADFADHPSNVGPLTLDQLRAETTRLARSFPTAPRLDIFIHARWLRDRLFDLLDARQRVDESRDLYFLAAAACGMLAHINDDLGYRDAAMTHAQTAWLCANEAGYGGMKAWILGTQSLIAYYGGRPAQAAQYARVGQEYATTGTISVWLAVDEARAVGLLGDRSGTTAALERASTARERVEPDELDELGGIMSFSAPKQHFYGTEAHLWLEAGSAIVAEAEACLAGYENGSEADRAYDNMAQTQANLAVAHVLARDLEAARDAVQPAFGLAPGLRNGAIDDRLRDLHRRLTAADIRMNPVAVALRDQIEDFLTTTAHTLPPG